jgi:hypothetical protein
MSSQKYIATNFLHIPSKGLCSSYPLKTWKVANAKKN